MTKYFSLLILLFIIDRFTKVAAIQGQSAFFDLLINKQLAFSLHMPESVIVIGSSIIIAVLTWILIRLVQKKSAMIWPLGILIAGAVSNLLDRLLYGGVVDFIPLLNISVINLSDLYITTGVLWILYTMVGKNKRGQSPI